ncbi:hypothetical protein GWI33_016519 [Rhynchophorus ferrugineus]|uniref:Uncharacterized protein n=1 Tax=Rhynchophorus ferrugineus TaxID=354439 RepID=A0A834HZW8_RHYFE|nr:hypothetical protein GWI33_016519 [Rhynchophorus ferrugineus]
MGQVREREKRPSLSGDKVGESLEVRVLREKISSGPVHLRIIESTFEVDNIKFPRIVIVENWSRYPRRAIVVGRDLLISYGRRYLMLLLRVEHPGLPPGEDLGRHGDVRRSQHDLGPGHIELRRANRQPNWE